MAEIHDLVARLGKEGAKAELVGRLADPVIPVKTRQRLAASLVEQVEKAAAMMADDTGVFNISYSGFCILALPHKALPKPTDKWERTHADGRFSLLIEPGSLRIGGKRLEFGVPFGSKARLILLYLQTQALLNRSREIRLGSSLYEWLNRMGIPVGGPNYRAVREQANRISAAKLSFSWSGERDGQRYDGFEHDSIVKRGVIFAGDEMADPAQPRLWEDTIVLSETFYNALESHPVPVSEAAIRAISNESWAIDAYIWLAYRLHSLEKPTLVTWANLRDQFGPGPAYQRLSNFKLKFTPVLHSALAVYPEAKVDLESKNKQGIVLYPSPPAIPQAKTHQVLLPTHAEVQTLGKRR
jgi:hypothetical protein